MPDYIVRNFIIYEDDKPLGPRASIDDIRTLGNGRFSYSRELGILLSPSNNDLKNTKHNYWVVLP